jgi:hypothetical protein
VRKIASRPGRGTFAAFRSGSRVGGGILRGEERLMSLNSTALLFLAGLCAALFAMLEIGRRLGLRRRQADPQAGAGLSAVDGAIYGLLGLLIAFTFSGAAARFDGRRQLIVQETNAIGTAYLRLDLLPAPARDELREKFKTYVDSRLAFYSKLADRAAAKADLDRSNALQGEIWTAAVAACKETGSPAVMSLVLPSLNDMIDITTTRLAAMMTHPPAVIGGMLLVLLLFSSLFAGISLSEGRSRNVLHMAGYAVLMTLALYVIADLEYPRMGFVRVDAFDQILVDLRASMK